MFSEDSVPESGIPHTLNHALSIHQIEHYDATASQMLIDPDDLEEDSVVRYLMRDPNGDDDSVDF